MKNQPKNKTSLLKSLILLFIASFYTACDEQTVYHSFQSLPTEGWQRNDTLFFNVSVADSATLYNVSVEVRNRNNYPYQNLPLLIYYDSPEIPNIKRDTLELRLADNAGIWLGDGWGGLYQSTLPAGFIRIGKAGEYRFKIIHLLPDEVLPGINDVGIKLKRWQSLFTSCINPQEDEQQDGESPKRRTAITKEWQRNTNHRCQSQHHAYINK